MTTRELIDDTMAEVAKADREHRAKDDLRARYRELARLTEGTDLGDYYANEARRLG